MGSLFPLDSAYFLSFPNRVNLGSPGKQILNERMNRGFDLVTSNGECENSELGRGFVWRVGLAGNGMHASFRGQSSTPDLI